MAAAVLGQEAPSVAHTDPVHQALHVARAVGRVRGHVVADGVVTRVGPAERLEEDDVMTELAQAHQVLEVMPRVAPYRIPHQVAGTHDPKAHVGSPDSRSWHVRRRVEAASIEELTEDMLSPEVLTGDARGGAAMAPVVGLDG